MTEKNINDFSLNDPSRRGSRGKDWFPFLVSQEKRMRERYADLGKPFPADHPTYGYTGLERVANIARAKVSSGADEEYIPGLEVKNIALEEISKAYWRAFTANGSEPSTDIIKPYLDHLVQEDVEDVYAYIAMIREEFGYPPLDPAIYSPVVRKKTGKHTAEVSPPTKDTSVDAHAHIDRSQ